MVNAPDCGSGYRGFESLYPPFRCKGGSLCIFWAIAKRLRHGTLTPASTVRIRLAQPCGYGGIGRRARFRFWWEPPCRFNSCYPQTTGLYCILHEVRFFYIIGNFSEISYYVKSSPRDAQLAAEKFALRHRSRAKCVQAHTFL